LWRVIPPLLAWIALLMTPAICASMLISGFIAHLWQDLRLKQLTEINLPGWFIPLAIRLTTVAVACLTLFIIKSMI
jgi:uncharacterized membrane protein